MGLRELVLSCRLDRTAFGHGKTFRSLLHDNDPQLCDRTKKQLKGRHFSSDAKVIAAAETWLGGQRSDFCFLSGLQKLEKRTKKCIELRGEYVE